jgi:hypothetical protein
MPGFDVDAVLKSMAAAAAGVLQTKWPKVKTFAETEFEKIAQTVVSIGDGIAAGTITKEQAPILLDMQKNASRAVLAAVEGMTLVAAEQAVNAALGAVKTAVNTFVGFPLLA